MLGGMWRWYWSAGDDSVEPTPGGRQFTAVNSEYVELRPSGTDEDYTLTLTIEGTGSIAGWTFAGKLWNGSGQEIVGAVSVSVVDADARKIAVRMIGQNLAALPYYQSYRYEVRRVDVGNRKLVVWGTLEPSDPSNTIP